RVKADGSIEEVETALLALGDVVLVRPGEKVPIDGVVMEGASSVNEAFVTGESKPVSKSPGDNVLGGTINGEGALRVRVTTMGGQRGLLTRNAEGLEAARHLDTILFDKTGTLTTGRFGVTDVIPFGSWSETDTLRLTAGVERNSEHVIAKAIVAHAESRGLSLPDVVDFTALPGKGARAKAERH